LRFKREEREEIVMQKERKYSYRSFSRDARFLRARGVRRGLIALALVVGFSLAATTGLASTVASTLIPVNASKNYQQVLAKLYKGHILPPPSTSPKAVKGKNVWYISCGPQFEACVDDQSGFLAAAKVLGWHVTVFNGQVLPTVASQGIREAIAAHASAITTLAYDCATIESALKEARAAHIPVIGSAGSDCTVQGGPSLFTSQDKYYTAASLGDYLYDWSVLKAEYIIAKTKGQAKVIDLHEVSSSAQEDAHAGFLKEMATCHTCKIVANVPFDFAHVTDVQQKVSAALLANPGANAINVPADTLIPTFVGPAVKQAHLAGKLLVMGGEG
jgi:ribose transport system substrate-binding protein